MDEVSNDRGVRGEFLFDDNVGETISFVEVHPSRHTQEVHLLYIATELSD